MTGASLILQGDALHLPLADESVDLVICSPPYYSLRAYSAGPGEIGSEVTPTEFLEALWAATREMARVLKPMGSLFVMLGDKYSTGNSGQSGLEQLGARYAGGGHTDGRAKQASERVRGFPPKTLLGLPWRYAIGCIDGEAGDALILRSEIIWSKPNGLLPESVTDRVRRSHEQVFHLTKQPRYYSATDEVRESYSQAPDAVHHRRNGIAQTTEHPSGDHNSSLRGRDGRRDPYENPLGKLPGSVWTIPSEPLRLPDHLGVQHYAAMPSEWPRRLILGWSPPGICLDCGQGRVPVVQRERTQTRIGTDAIRGPNDGSVIPQSGGNGFGQRAETSATILGYACACTPHTNHPGSGSPPRDATIKMPGTIPRASDQNGGTKQAGDYQRVGPWREYHLHGWTPPPTRPAVVLDCFGGTGTTALVARALGRIGITVDLSWSYSRLAKYRIFQSGDSGKALSRTWAERQGSLLSDAPSAEGS